MTATLTINRYEKNDNSIYSNCIYRDKNTVANFEGVEAVGYEIEKGTYESTYTHSPKFNRKLYVIDVPNRSGIRIHTGNSYKDTVGCVVIGEYRRNNIILNSRRAVELLHQLSKQQNIKIIINERFSRQNSSKGIREVIRNLIKCVREMAENRP